MKKSSLLRVSSMRFVNDYLKDLAKQIETYQSQETPPALSDKELEKLKATGGGLGVMSVNDAIAFNAKGGTPHAFYNWDEQRKLFTNMDRIGPALLYGACPLVLQDLAIVCDLVILLLLDPVIDQNGHYVYRDKSALPVVDPDLYQKLIDEHYINPSGNNEVKKIADSFKGLTGYTNERIRSDIASFFSQQAPAKISRVIAFLTGLLIKQMSYESAWVKKLDNDQRSESDGGLIIIPGVGTIDYPSLIDSQPDASKDSGLVFHEEVTKTHTYNRDNYGDMLSDGGYEYSTGSEIKRALPTVDGMDNSGPSTDLFNRSAAYYIHNAAMKLNGSIADSTTFSKIIESITSTSKGITNTPYKEAYLKLLTVKAYHYDDLGFGCFQSLLSGEGSYTIVKVDNYESSRPDYRDPYSTEYIIHDGSTLNTSYTFYSRAVFSQTHANYSSSKKAYEAASTASMSGTSNYIAEYSCNGYQAFKLKISKLDNPEFDGTPQVLPGRTARLVIPVTWNYTESVQVDEYKVFTNKNNVSVSNLGLTTTKESNKTYITLGQVDAERIGFLQSDDLRSDITDETKYVQNVVGAPSSGSWYVVYKFNVQSLLSSAGVAGSTSNLRFPPDMAIKRIREIKYEPSAGYAVSATVECRARIETGLCSADVSLEVQSQL